MSQQIFKVSVSTHVFVHNVSVLCVLQ